MFEKYLKDNVHFIVPYSLKKIILKQIHDSKKLLNISFSTMEEAFEKLYLTYDERSINYISKEYNIKVENAVVYLDSLFYCLIGKKTQLAHLTQIKNKLDSLNYLSYDEHYFKQFKDKEVVIAGYYDDNYNTKLIKEKIGNYVEIKNELIDKQINVYEFKTIEEEVNFIIYKIANLLNDGVDINKIKLINVSDDYIPCLKKMFYFYNINNDLNESKSLFNIPIIKTFLSLLNENDLQTSLTLLKDKYDFNKDANISIYNKIISVMNRFNWHHGDYFSIIKLIEYTFKKETITDDEKEGYVGISSLDIEAVLDNHVFLLGFNQGEFPLIYKDLDYVNDEIKTLINCDTSIQLNKKEKIKTIDLLKRINNLTLSYKLNTVESEFYPSSLLDELNHNIIRDFKNDLSLSFSSKHDLVNLSDKIDNLTKFSLYHKDLEILKSNYPDFKHNSYDNQFKGLEKNDIPTLLNNELKISFTKLDVFFNCSFKYYLECILKLDKFEESFEMKIGNLFHYVLSKIFDNDFDFQITFNNYIKTITLNNKEEILMVRLKEELLKIVNTIRQQYNSTSFKKVYCEQKLSVEMKSKISVILSGTIDKIMVLEDENKRYGYIVDYKTGYFDKNIGYLDYGINTQLAIYLYLLKNSKDYADVFIVGFYLQKILSDSKIDEFKQTKKSVEYYNAKLDGYTIKNLSLIQKIDNNYINDGFLKGITVKKEGDISATSSVIEPEAIQETLELIQLQIQKAIKDIEDGNFLINPKKIKSNIDSCKFCEHQGICFKKHRNYIPSKLEENDDDDDNDDNDFGGDDNE